MYLTIWPLSRLFGGKSGHAILAELSYCTRCGTRLEEAHRYCSNCGTARQQPAGSDSERQPRPTGGSSAEDGRVAVAASGPRPKLPDHVNLVAILSAVAAVIFLVLLAQTAALIANPNGRDSLDQILAQAGVASADRPGVLILYEVMLVLLSLVPAILHGAAFYGLIGVRRAGWVIAFLLAVGWSLVLIGIPFAYLLWRRDTREAFGVS
jgi:hypothetical protein